MFAAHFDRDRASGGSSRGRRLRFRTPLVVVSTAIALLSLGLADTGGSLALWNSTARAQAASISSGKITATETLSPGLNVSYSSTTNTITGGLTIGNSGTVDAAYSSVITLGTGSSALASAIDVTIWGATSATTCTASATPVSPATSTWSTIPSFVGNLRAGSSIAYCIRTTLARPSGVGSGSTVAPSITTTLSLGGWTSVASVAVAQSFLDNSAPTAPTGLSSSGTTGTSATILWRASTDNVGVTGYDIYRGTALAGSVSGTTTAFTDTALTAGTAYDYTVRAKDANGNVSATSAAFSFTTVDSSAWYQVVNTQSGKCLDVKAENTSVLQQWACGSPAASNQTWRFQGSSTAAYYNVAPQSTPANVWDVSERVTTDGGSVIVYPLTTAGASNQQWRVVPLGNGTYQFIANHSSKCLDVYGDTTLDGATLQQLTCNSADASQTFRMVTISDATAPTVPTRLSSSNTTDTSTVLSWTASTDNVAVTGYDIYSGADNLGTVSGAPITITGLNAGVSYSFSVKARDAAGNVSAASSALSVTAQAYVDSSAFYQVINVNSNKCVDGDGAGTANGTKLLQWSCATPPGSNQTWQFQGPNAAGYYSVVPRYSASIVWDVSGVSTADGAQVYLWAPTAAANQQWRIVPAGSGTYQFVNRNSGKCLQVVGASTTNGALMQQLTCASADTSQTFRIVPLDTAAPTAPTNLTSSNVTSSSAKLTWSASSDNVGVTAYDIYRGTTLAGTVSSSTLAFTDANLAGSTTYSYTVKARDAAGNVSAASATRSVTTTTSLTCLQPNANYVEYRWTTPAGATTRYSVYLNATSVTNNADGMYTWVQLSNANAPISAFPAGRYSVDIRQILAGGGESPVGTGSVLIGSNGTYTCG